MKKLVLMFCFLAFSTPKIYSQMFVENFDYAAGLPLAGNGGWGVTSGTGTLPLNVSSPGLFFPLYSGSGIGNSSNMTVFATGAASGDDDTCRFTSSRDTGSVYAAFMVKVDSGKATGDYFFSYMNFSGNVNTFVGRVFERDSAASGGKFAFGLSKNAGTGDVYTPASYSRDSTYLIILKYTFIAGLANDSVRLFVLRPTDVLPLLEPSPTLSAGGSGTDLTNVGKILLRQGPSNSSPSVKVDGIYVNNFWDGGLLPVELSSFTSAVNSRNVTLNWITVSEINNSGFEIERATGIRNGWRKVGFVSGHGNSGSSNSYYFADRNLTSGSYQYRLKQRDYNGAFEYFNLTNEVVIGLPGNYSLSQNYPNPFNPVTVINYQIPKSGDVSIKIYDISGKEIRSLVNERKDAGYYSVSLDASNLASGAYFYTINTNDFINTKSMLLVK